MKIVFIVDFIYQPRCIKRVTSFLEAGYECEVYGYTRNRFTSNVYPSKVKLTILGEMHDGADYLKKLKMLYGDINTIVSKYKSESTVYYSFGFISTLFLFLKRKEYIYEISDILYGYPRFDKIAWLLRNVDRRIIKNSIATVMTSEGFYEYFNLNLDKIILQPNKVNRNLISIERKPLTETIMTGLTFAFVGAVRYDTIFRFAEVIGKYFPQHRFHFYGLASNKTIGKVNLLTEKYSNVKYFGEFKNPDDLEQIYSQISIVVACYTPSSLNERLAEPNKLYESIFFCKPIIVSDGIFLSRQVQKYKCGFSIDATTEESIKEFINNISIKQLLNISRNEVEIGLDVTVDDPTLILEKTKQYLKEKKSR